MSILAAENSLDERVENLEKQIAAMAADLLDHDSEALGREVRLLEQQTDRSVKDLHNNIYETERRLYDAMKKAERELTTLRQSILDRAAISTIAATVARNVLKDVRVQKVAVTVNGREPVTLDRQHKLFPALLRRVVANAPVMLIGPAGSGKTSAAEATAQALSLTFYHQSVGVQTSKADLLGYKDANGIYHPSPLFRAFTEGGVYLLDELDAGNPGVLTILNAALANGHMTFGDGEQHERHTDFRPLAAANTYGTGANRQYVGRNQLDASTLDRFARMQWGYDEEFEKDLALAENSEAADWIRFVQRVRKVCEEKKILHIVSPRASIFGARLLAAGIPRTEIEQEWVWTNLTPVQIEQIRRAL